MRGRNGVDQRHHYDKGELRRALLNNVMTLREDAFTREVREAFAQYLQRDSESIKGLFYSVLEDLVFNGELWRVPQGRHTLLVIPSEEAETLHEDGLHLVPLRKTSERPKDSIESLQDLAGAFRGLSKAFSALGQVADHVQATCEEGLDLQWREKIELFCATIIERLDRIEKRLK